MNKEPILISLKDFLEQKKIAEEETKDYISSVLNYDSRWAED